MGGRKRRTASAMLAGALTAIALGVGGAIAAEPTISPSDGDEGRYTTVQGAVPDDILEALLEEDGDSDDSTPSPDPSDPEREAHAPSDPESESPAPSDPEGETPEVPEVPESKKPKIEESVPPDRDADAPAEPSSSSDAATTPEPQPRGSPDLGPPDRAPPAPPVPVSPLASPDPAEPDDVDPVLDGLPPLVQPLAAPQVPACLTSPEYVLNQRSGGVGSATTNPVDQLGTTQTTWGSGADAPPNGPVADYGVTTRDYVVNALECLRVIAGTSGEMIGTTTPIINFGARSNDQFPNGYQLYGGGDAIRTAIKEDGTPADPIK